MDAADELGGNEMRRISKAETGKRIRKLLVESGITVREVQEAMELESPQAVYKWLNGKALPSTENLLILSEMLRMPMEQILVLDRSKVSEGCLWRLWKYPPVIWSYRPAVPRRLEAFSILLEDVKNGWPPKWYRYGPEERTEFGTGRKDNTF